MSPLLIDITVSQMERETTQVRALRDGLAGVVAERARQYGLGSTSITPADAITRVPTWGPLDRHEGTEIMVQVTLPGFYRGGIDSLSVSMRGVLTAIASIATWEVWRNQKVPRITWYLLFAGCAVSFTTDAEGRRAPRR